MKKIMYVFRLLPFLLSAKKSKMGGQAVIEGVMMRGKQKISWAVRKPDGEMVIESSPFISLCKKYKILKTPVIRGAINLYEALAIGYRALTRSAEIAMPEEEKAKENGKNQSFAMILSMVVALVAALALFMYLPMFIANLFFEKTALSFNFVAGVARIAIFILYLVAISFGRTFEGFSNTTAPSIRPYSLSKTKKRLHWKICGLIRPIIRDAAQVFCSSWLLSASSFFRLLTL